MSLASHMEKIRTLEGMLAEHEAIKREVSAMRELMEGMRKDGWNPWSDPQLINGHE